jgi:hypothetical protein
MPEVLGARQHTCARCAQSFTSQGRLGHHWAAEHAPRTSSDIPRTSQVMAATRHKVPRASRYFCGKDTGSGSSGR